MAAKLHKVFFGACQFGVTIISGLAYGVDTAAHRGCLSVGGKTAAVWAMVWTQFIQPKTQGLLMKLSKPEEL